MSIPFFGRMTLSGFTHPWFFLLLFVAAALVLAYILAQRFRHKRALRFANSELLDSVVSKNPGRWRHLPAILLVASLVVATVGLAGPTHDVRIPRNRAVVMLVIQVSPAMTATDVEPTRLAAAQQAGKRFAEQLTPGVNLGLVAFAGTPTVLVSPTTDHQATVAAIDKLQVSLRTAVGDAIFTALQSIATVGSVLGTGTQAPPSRIVLESTGHENHPMNPDAPRGEFTAARTARGQGVPISTIAFGTPDGTIELQGAHLTVPVNEDALKKIAELSGGYAFQAGTMTELDKVYNTIANQIGYETIRGDASTSWFRLATLLLVAAAVAGLLINRRLPN